MTAQLDRTAALDLLKQGHELITDALKQVPEEAFDFKPGPNKWSVREVVIHLADSEANGYVRLRKLIAENGSSVTNYDQDGWAQELHYAQMDVNEALALFKMLRAANAKLISQTPDIVWSTHAINHPEHGSYTLEDWLRTYSNHIPGHVGQIQRNMAAWQESK